MGEARQRLKDIEHAFRERLAALEHEQWMAWSQSIATTEAISPERLSRWAAMWVPYEELTEAQKDMDREWADKVLAAIMDDFDADEAGHVLLEAIHDG